MCLGDDPNCDAFAEHRRKFRAAMEPERRAFLKSSFVATGGAAAAFAGGISLVSPALAETSASRGVASRHSRLLSNTLKKAVPSSELAKVEYGRKRQLGV